jgi:ATP-dependent Lon protease
MEKLKLSEKDIPRIVPILSVSNDIIFPRMILTVEIHEDISELVSLLESKEAKDRIIGILMPKSDEDGNFYEVGTVVLVHGISKMHGSNGLKLNLQGIKKFKLNSFVGKESYLQGKITIIKEINQTVRGTKALVPPVLKLFADVVKNSSTIPREFSNMASTVKKPSQLADMIVSSLSITLQKKQEFLSIRDVKIKLKTTMEILNQELDIKELGGEIASQTKKNMEEHQKNYYLRQQLAAIKKELGETGEGDDDEVEEYRQRIKEAKLPEAASKQAKKELKRLENLSSSSQERSIITTYLDCLAEIPWEKSTEDKLDVPTAKKILDDDHYGLEKPKRRILEYLAVRQLKTDSQGPVLCFSGPPGTGKTSLGKSIARSLGREFIRISLGGVRDEAEIRGHRRTYIGAMAGRIIQGIRRAGTNNPVFMLDEIDKVGNDFKGDPASALLEVLDPEQNFSFSDHYLDVPFDLSKVMFITTANVLETIPPALKDRMEVIEFSGYTHYEKIRIAKQFLIPKQRKAHGLKGKQISFTEGALNRIINSYTYESGVRNLERQIGTGCRRVATGIVSKEIKSATIKLGNLRKYIGREKNAPETVVKDMVVGTSIALFVGGNGGSMGYIEAAILNSTPEDEQFVRTGQLGDVMEESTTIAYSYLSSIAGKLGIDTNVRDNTIHIHFPAGGQQKDGPSAGVALFCALASLFMNKPMKKAVAITGEITLKGEVLPVGGVKEKIIGAHRAGVRTIILPKWNEIDLEDVPQEIKDDMKFYPISNAKEALKIAFG